MPTEAARRLTRRVIWASGLAWTRDGKSVVYGDGISGRLCRVGIAGDALPQRIEVAGFGAGQPAIAASSDRLAFVRSGSARRSTGSWRAVGPRSWPPPRLAIGIRTFHPTAAASPSSRRAAAQETRSGWPRPTERTRSSSPTGRGCGKARRTGRRTAAGSPLIRLAEDGQWDIWTIDAEGGSLRRLTSDPADDNQPTWSNDGRFVYFSSNRSGTEAIWRAAATGGSEVQVTHDWRLARPGDARRQDALVPTHFPCRIAAPRRAPRRGPGANAHRLRASLWLRCRGGRHLPRGLRGGPSAAPLFLLDPATGRDQLLGTVKDSGQGLTASPDGKTILFTAQRGEGTDLVLIENFR